MSSENEELPGFARKGGDEGAVTKLDSGHLRKLETEQDAHIGVKLIEAAEQVYGRRSKWLILLGIAVASYALSLDKETTGNYLPFAASTYDKHHLISAIQVAQSVIVACVRPVIAQFANVRSRAQACVLSLILTVLGYIITTSAHEVGSLGAGIVLHAIGYTALQLLNAVLIADITTLEWRGAVAALTYLPVIINAFIGSNVAAQVIERSGWRWGYGMFAILIPASSAPLILPLLWAERKAKNTGIVPKVTITDVGILSKAWIFCEQLDLFGLVLMGTSVALILLPLTLATNGQGGWRDPSMISMIVVGCVLLPITVFWEIKFATRPILAHRLLSNKTVMFSVLIEFFDNFSSLVTSMYLYSYILVTKPWSLLDMAYFNQTEMVASVVFGITCGFAMRRLHRFKLLLVVGLGARLVGVALMIHSRSPRGSVAEIVSTQILQGIGGGSMLVCTIVGSQAAVPHSDMATTTAMILLWNDIGTAVGSAVAGAIWTNTMQDSLAKYLPNVNATYRAELFDSITLVTRLPYDDPIRQGVISAYGDVMKILIITATCIAVIPFALSFFIPDWHLGDKQNAVENVDLQIEQEAHLSEVAEMNEISLRRGTDNRSI